MLRCIVVDDEKLALELLEDTIKQVPFLQLVALCRSSAEAIEVLLTQEVDLIFLDVNMPGMSGINLLRSLKAKPAVIITSAHEQYALEAFNLDVVDYLLKPFDFERFMKAVTKAYEFTLYKKKKETAPETADFLFVKVEYEFVKINILDIKYIEGLKDYIKIFTTREKPFLTLSTLKEFLERLPAGHFVRIHNSFIVAVNAIEAIRNSRLTVKGRELPISVSYKDAVKKALKISAL